LVSLPINRDPSDIRCAHHRGLGSRQPTPDVGLEERVLSYVFLLWVVMLGVALFGSGSRQSAI
jgi:hypothetical protein